MDEKKTPQHDPADLVIGANAIAKVLGPAFNARKVRHLASKRLLPLFHVGGNLAARVSTITAHVVDLERSAIEEMTTRKHAVPEPVEDPPVKRRRGRPRKAVSA